MPSAQTQEIIQLTKNGMGAMIKSLQLYGNDVDQVIPWKNYQDTVKELDRYRSDYSTESGQLVGEIKSLISSAQDSYYTATQSVYEWCGVAKQLLDKYRNLFDQRTGDSYAQQRAILIQILDLGAKKMGAGQEKLQESSMSFNNASGKLTNLHSRFTNEFDSKSSYYQGQVNKIRTEAYAGAAAGAIGGPLGLLIAYSIAAGIVEGQKIPELNEKLRQTQNFFDHLRSLIDKSDRDIGTTKEKLRGEVKNIGDMKVKAETTETLVPLDDLDALRDSVVGSVTELIAQCNEYQKRHGQRN